MFKINDRVRLKHDNKENPSLTVRSEVGGQRFLCISDCGQRMVWACDRELELVERNADLKQAIREVLLSEEFLMEFAAAWQKTPLIHGDEIKLAIEPMVDSFDANEPEQPAWTPKIGDWVRIRKPSDNHASATSWWPSMDKYDGQIIQVKEIDGDGVVHKGWGFLFDWLEPVEPTLYSDKTPEGYRKLNDSSEEPRQLGDLRWSVAEKRYIEISGDEIGYANRDNWAACRKVEPAIKQSLTTEPPAGWRFLEVCEMIRKGDKYRDLKSQTWIECVGAVGDSLQDFHKPTIRRNRFEVGEKVVYIPDQSVWTYVSEINDGPNHPKSALVASGSTSLRVCVTRLAPYIEETK